MIKRVKLLGYVLTGIVSVLMVSGVLLIWLGTTGDTVVSADSRVCYKGTSTDSVGLMFNVYSGSEFLPDILETLSSNGAKATFFVGGTWAEKNETMLKEIVAGGHEIGNHGYLHRDHDKLNKQGNRDEISLTHKLVRSICGYEMTLFAPPSGAYSTVTVDVAEELGYKTIMWSKDTIDWRDHDTHLITERATKDVVGGDLILMHPTANTAEALPEIVNKIKSNNLNLAVVSDVL
ncbi:MAG: polysaccharide deacetylase family protein [Clostridia bacterium]|nr:polysaccharide deacetylase family protein [Clostridia bacterium]